MKQDFTIGAKLKEKIAEELNIRFERPSGQKSGDSGIYNALQQYCREMEDEKVNISSFLEAAWQICDALPQAISIDSYIDAQRGNKEIELCGKLGIARSIVENERNSMLYFNGAPSKKESLISA